MDWTACAWLSAPSRLLSSGMRTPGLALVALLAALAPSACSDDSPQGESVALGGTGESCTARRDCAAGLACVEQVCIDPAAVDGGLPIQQRGSVGESCRASNDC